MTNKPTAPDLREAIARVIDPSPGYPAAIVRALDMADSILALLSTPIPQGEDGWLSDIENLIDGWHPEAEVNLGSGVRFAHLTRLIAIGRTSEALLAACRALKAAFGDPLTRRALGGHNEVQMSAIIKASHAIARAAGGKQ